MKTNTKSRTKNEVHKVQYATNVNFPPNLHDRSNSSQPASDNWLRMTKKKQAEASLNDDDGRLSKKYEYASKLREKRNYVYYVSGVGYVTKEEEPEPPKPKPISIPKVVNKEEEAFIERKKIIDNYQYHETKDLSNANKTSNVFHKRLAQPFEVTQQVKVKKIVPHIEQQTVYVTPGEQVHEIDETSHNRKPYQQTNQKRIQTTVVSKRNNKPLNGNEMSNEQLYEEVTEGVYYQEPAKGGNNYGFYKSKNAPNKRGEGASTSYYQKRTKSTSNYSKGNSSFQGTNAYKGRLVKNGTSNPRGKNGIENIFYEFK